MYLYVRHTCGFGIFCAVHKNCGAWVRNSCALELPACADEKTIKSYCDVDWLFLNASEKIAQKVKCMNFRYYTCTCMYYAHSLGFLGVSNSDTIIQDNCWRRTGCIPINAHSFLQSIQCSRLSVLLQGWTCTKAYPVSNLGFHIQPHLKKPLLSDSEIGLLCWVNINQRPHRLEYRVNSFEDEFDSRQSPFVFDWVHLADWTLPHPTQYAGDLSQTSLQLRYMRQ